MADKSTWSSSPTKLGSFIIPTKLGSFIIPRNSEKKSDPFGSISFRPLQFTQKICGLTRRSASMMIRRLLNIQKKTIGAGKYGVGIRRLRLFTEQPSEGCKVATHTKTWQSNWRCFFLANIRWCWLDVPRKKNMYSKASDSVVCLYLMHVRNGSRGSRYSRMVLYCPWLSLSLP